MDGRMLTPWDAFRLFDPPSTTIVSCLSGVKIQLCGANPHRIALIISPTTVIAGTIVIRPQGTGNFTAGIALALGFPFMITHNDYGALVQYGWDALSIAGNNSLAVVEQTIHDFPGGE